MDISDLADACQKLAEDLDNEQAALHYAGSQAITLGKLSTNLSAQACTLRTLVVANAIMNSTDAIAQLKEATKQANAAVTKLKAAASAIQIAGLVLTLSAAIVSENPTSVVSAAKNLISAVTALP
jgi:hypothetical protein